MSRSLESAYSPIASVPTVINATGTATPVVIPDSTGPGGVGGGNRRVRVANVGDDLGGIVWALRSDASGTKITGQDLGDATQISAGTAETFLVSASMSIGYVGATEFSITISEA